ncbi:hypothetical protein DL93DRAFT_2233406 [Clavulina sp. PMI_390]|nr:hypothetical protein DL93DRAFT_2233406 [Clavulina sp. PMI_390]
MLRAADPDLWECIDHSMTSWLKEFMSPIPIPPPTLALEPSLRDASYASTVAMADTLEDCARRVDGLILQLCKARQHLQTCAAQVRTSLAPIAALTPSLLSDIFCFVLHDQNYVHDRRILKLISVCSSWRDIVNGMPALFTSWKLDRYTTRDLDVVRSWRARSRGKALTVRISEYLLSLAFSPKPQGDETKRAGLEAELLATITQCSHLTLDLQSLNLSVIPAWASLQNLERLETLVIRDPAWRMRGPRLLPVGFPLSPKLNTLCLVNARVRGFDASALLSLTCAPNTSWASWTKWVQLIMSCTGLVHLRLLTRRLNALWDNDVIDIDLPRLVRLELGGVDDVYSKVDLRWQERFIRLATSLHAPQVQSFTLLNIRPPSPEDSLSIWNCISQTFPQITVLHVIEPFYHSHTKTPLIGLDPLFEHSTTSGGGSTKPLFPKMVEFGVLTLPQIPEELPSTLQSFLQARTKGKSSFRLTTTREIAELLKVNSFDALEHIRSSVPGFEIVQVAGHDIPNYFLLMDGHATW